MFFVKNRMVNAKMPGIIHRKMIPGFVYVFFSFRSRYVAVFCTLSYPLALFVFLLT